jgi:hypothetical protein
MTCLYSACANNPHWSPAAEVSFAMHFRPRAGTVFSADDLRSCRPQKVENCIRLSSFSRPTPLGAAALSSAASLLKHKTGSGMVKWRLHAHFEVDRSVPIRIDVTRRAGLWTGRKPTLRSSLQVGRRTQFRGSEHVAGGEQCGLSAQARR